MNAATDKELDTRLAAVLALHNATTCPECGRIIDRYDVAWNCGTTDAGTGYSVVEVQCQSCGTEIANVSAWSEAVSFEDVIDILEADWRSVP